MMVATKKRASRAPPPAPWYANMKHPAAILAVLSLLAIIGGWWSSAGNWRPADEREFRNFKDEVSRGLATTKTEVLQHSDKNTAKVEAKLDTFTAGLTKSLRQQQIEALEKEERDMTWSQRRILANNLVGIDRQLSDPKKRNDVILTERKAEIEGTLKALDSRIAETHARILRLKEQQ